MAYCDFSFHLIGAMYGSDIWGRQAVIASPCELRVGVCVVTSLSVAARKISCIGVVACTSELSTQQTKE